MLKVTRECGFCPTVLHSLDSSEILLQALACNSVAVSRDRHWQLYPRATTCWTGPSSAMCCRAWIPSFAPLLYRMIVHFGQFWTILGPFWDHFGPFWDHFGTIFGPFWDHFGATSAGRVQPRDGRGPML